MKNIRFFYLKIFPFFILKVSIYLKRRVFVMVCFCFASNRGLFVSPNALVDLSPFVAKVNTFCDYWFAFVHTKESILNGKNLPQFVLFGANSFLSEWTVFRREKNNFDSCLPCKCFNSLLYQTPLRSEANKFWSK